MAGLPEPELKDLYLFSSLQELISAAKVKNIERTSARLILRLADSIFKNGRKYEIEGDEERALHLFYRYCDAISFAMEKKDYQENKKDLKKLVHKSKFNYTISAVDQLKSSLTKRYALLDLEGYVPMYQKLDDVQVQSSDNDSDSDDEDEEEDEPPIPGVKRGSCCLEFGYGRGRRLKKVDVQVQVRTNGNSKNERDEKAEEKEKEEGEKEEKEEEEEEEEEEVSAPVITPRQLKSLRSMQNILIIDCRDHSSFIENHLDHPKCINIPRTCLVPGISANMIQKSLEKAIPESFKEWKNRNSFQWIILYDEDSTFDRRGKDLENVYNALVKWDLENNEAAAASKVLVVEGGLEGIMNAYPELLQQECEGDEEDEDGISSP